MPVGTPFSVQVGRIKLSRFQLELVFVNDERNFAPLYIAPVKSCLEHKLPEQMVNAAWNNYLQKGEGAVKDLTFSSDDSPEEIHTVPLTMLRHGSQIVRVYTDHPDKVKLICLPLVTDNFEPISDERGAQGSVWGLTLDFCGREFDIQGLVKGNIGVFNKTQIVKHGIKSERYRETLRFTGTKEQRIRYWYDNPKITVVGATDFLDINGKKIDQPEQRQGFAIKTADDWGCFDAEKVCWGVLTVEYVPTYAEFQIIYALPAKLNYVVETGEITPLGQNTSDLEGIEISWAETLEGITLKPDRVQFTPKNSAERQLTQGLGFTKLNFKDEESPDYNDNYSEVIALKLFSKIKFASIKCDPIEIFVNDSSSADLVTLSAQPEILLTPESKNIPAVAIYEKRKRERIYPSGAGQGENFLEVDHIEEIITLDIYGNIKRENLEKRKGTT